MRRRRNRRVSLSLSPEQALVIHQILTMSRTEKLKQSDTGRSAVAILLEAAKRAEPMLSTPRIVRKPTCPNGHEYTEANTAKRAQKNRNIVRQCRICRQAANERRESKRSRRRRERRVMRVEAYQQELQP